MAPSQTFIRSGSPIEFLHFEILSIIFEHVYEMCRSDDILDPSSFPYAMAAVCTAWRDVLSLTPKYWTQVIAFTNPALPSSSDVRSCIGIEHQLRWSRDLPIRVQVTKLPSSVLETVEDEHRIVRTAINFLKPHIGRCLAITYNVTYSSSLPLITVDMNHAANLIDLNLVCDIANGAGGDPGCSPLSPNVRLPGLLQSFSTTLDGWNFIDLYRKAPEWIGDLLDTNGLDIAIRGYNEIDSGGEFWECLAGILPAVTHLELNSIQVTTVLQDQRFSAAPPEVYSLRLNNVSSTLINEILHAIEDWEELEELDITKCAIGTISNRTKSFSLTLRNIPTTENLSPFLSLWKGQKLVIYDCPAFNDNILSILSARELNPDELLWKITLSDCTDVTVAGMRMFAEERAKQLAGVNSLGTIMLDIDVRGKAQNLSEEDREWFNRKLRSFSWNVDVVA